MFKRWTLYIHSITSIIYTDQEDCTIDRVKQENDYSRVSARWCSTIIAYINIFTTWPCYSCYPSKGKEAISTYLLFNNARGPIRSLTYKENWQIISRYRLEGKLGGEREKKREFACVTCHVNTDLAACKTDTPKVTPKLSVWVIIFAITRQYKL